MKIFTLSSVLLLLSIASFSQSNPCPNIVSYNYGVISSSGSNCTSTVKVKANGIGVSAQKGLLIEVYKNNITPANLISSKCFTIAGQSADAYYETDPFTLPCATPISYVITRTTSSSGGCGGGICSGSTAIVVQSGPLPIKISSFFAHRNANTVALNWTTESEINAKEFIIERNSGNGFTAIGSIDALNKETGSSYNYIDNNNSKTVSQYRLKMVDKDASFKFSETKAVKGTAAVSDFTVYPNPSSGSTRVNITDISEASKVEVIDNAGRITKTIILTRSNFIDLYNLQKGIYLIRITNEKTGDAVTRKLSVIN